MSGLCRNVFTSKQCVSSSHIPSNHLARKCFHFLFVMQRHIETPHFTPYTVKQHIKTPPPTFHPLGGFQSANNSDETLQTHKYNQNIICSQQFSHDTVERYNNHQHTADGIDSSLPPTNHPSDGDPPDLSIKQRRFCKRINKEL